MNLDPRTTVYCVGGGKSLEDFDFSLLKGRRCIAINMAYRTVPHAEAVLFIDRRFWDWHAEGRIGDVGELLAHPGRRITVARNFSHPKVETWRATGARGLDTAPGCLRLGNNSGYAAINLAVHLGARTVVLLGYDMSAPEGEEGKVYADNVHWHDGYPVKVRPGAFGKMLPFFRSIKGPLDELGVRVINANEGSRLDVFDKMPRDVLFKGENGAYFVTDTVGAPVGIGACALGTK